MDITTQKSSNELIAKNKSFKSPEINIKLEEMGIKIEINNNGEEFALYTIGTCHILKETENEKKITEHILVKGQKISPSEEMKEEFKKIEKQLQDIWEEIEKSKNSPK